MIRIQELVERNVRDLKLLPVSIASGTRADVFPDSTGDVKGETMNNYEFAYLAIFNANASGGSNIYVAFGRDADKINNFVCYLTPGQMLEIKTRERVSVYASTADSVVARTALARMR